MRKSCEGGPFHIQNHRSSRPVLANGKRPEAKPKMARKGVSKSCRERGRERGGEEGKMV